MKLLAHLRTRLAVLFTTGFGILLLGGGLTLYGWMARGYRADFDRMLDASGEALLELFQQELDWFPEPHVAAEHVVSEMLFPDRAFMAFDGERLLGVSHGPEGIPDPQSLRALANGGGPDAEYQVLRIPLQGTVSGYVALPLAPLDARLARLRLTLLLGLPLILVVGGLLGAAGARMALRPVVGVADAACALAEDVARGSDVFKRLPHAPADDEVRELTQAFNTLTDRLEAALARERELVQHQRDFLATAAHELRMPVTILRTEAEVALEGEEDASRYQAALEHVVDESGRLGDLVADLLLLARADATRPRLTPVALYLDDLVGGVLARVRRHPAAANRVIQVGRFDPAPVEADRTLTERAVGVLVHNALVHGGDSWVDVHTGSDQDVAWVEVHDGGPGIPPGGEERIFERFVRLDPEAGGSGLGLAIARWIAEVQGGSLRGWNRPEGGAAFRLELPLRPQSATDTPSEAADATPEGAHQS